MFWTDIATKQIKEMRIPHRNYERALSDAMSALIACAPGEVMCITGPSRVGKSRLAEDLAKLITGGQPISDGVMPVVSIRATNCSVGGSFSTKSFTLRALAAVQHPFYGVGRGDDVWETDRFRLIERTPEGVLRPAFEHALVQRKTRYFFIDEAHHIRYARGGDWGAAAILDSWKCLAGDADIVLVLIGAYPLLNVLRLCPHLLGRKHQVHFPRYYPTRDDLLAFEQILEAYSEVLRLPSGVRSLREWNELLYPDSLGCIGLIEGWLREGLATTRSRNDKTLTKEHLQASRKALHDRVEIAGEIAQGEEALNAGPEGDIEIEKENGAGKTEATPKKPKRTRKPFQKKPRRYAVGGRY